MKLLFSLLLLFLIAQAGFGQKLSRQEAAEKKAILDEVCGCAEKAKIHDFSLKADQEAYGNCISQAHKKHPKAFARIYNIITLREAVGTPAQVKLDADVWANCPELYSRVRASAQQTFQSVDTSERRRIYEEVASDTSSGFIQERTLIAGAVCECLNRVAKTGGEIGNPTTTCFGEAYTKHTAEFIRAYGQISSDKEQMLRLGAKLGYDLQELCPETILQLRQRK